MNAQSLLISCVLLHIAILACPRAELRAGESKDVCILTESAIDEMKIDSPEIVKLLKTVLLKMRSIDKEVKVLTEANWKNRENKQLAIESKIDNAYSIVSMALVSENGPVYNATRSVFKDSDYKEEIKHRRWQIAYEANGKINYFELGVNDPVLHNSDSELGFFSWLRFYPSGRLEFFQVIHGDSLVVDLSVRDDGVIAKQIYNKEK